VFRIFLFHEVKHNITGKTLYITTNLIQMYIFTEVNSAISI